MGFKVLENELHRDWVEAGASKIIDMPQGYFLIMFKKEEDYRRALFEGPWKVADHYILVQRWRLSFMANAQWEKKIAAWINVPGLSMELFNDQFLWRLGSLLGTMLKIDYVTSTQERGKYARICVELDLEKPLESEVIAQVQVVQLEYKSLHLICFSCGKYGHKANNCSEVRSDTTPLQQDGGEPQSEQSEPKEKEQEEPNLADRADISMENSVAELKEQTNENIGEDNVNQKGTSEYGPWMIVRKPNRKQNKRNGGNIPKKKKDPRNGAGDSVPKRKDTGSRFHVIMEGHADTADDDITQAPIMQNEKHVFSAGNGARVRNNTGGKNPQKNKNNEVSRNTRKIGDQPKYQIVPHKPIHVGLQKNKGIVIEPKEKENRRVILNSRKEKEAIALENMRIIQKHNPYAGLYDVLRKDPLREATQAMDDDTIRLVERLRKVFSMSSNPSRPPEERADMPSTSNKPQEERAPMEGVTVMQPLETESMVATYPNMSQ